MSSIWWQTNRLPEFESLGRDIKTEVLIIGGGMAGILCAYMLSQAGAKCVLTEAERICGGITKNTTAKITSQHGLIYDKLIRRFGVEKAQMYLMANEAALSKYRELSQDVDCDFEDRDAYTYSLSGKKKIERELSALGKMGFRAEYAQKLPLPFSVDGALCFKRQAQFDPLKFISAIQKDLNIYEKTTVRELRGHRALTGHGEISADQIIIATHFPFINKHGSYFLKMYQHRSYVLAVENAPKLREMYVDEAQSGMSFRNYRELLLIGGGGHRSGKQGGGWPELEAFARRNYPKAHEKYRWATQDCITLDGVPYIGHYSKRTPYLYVATGFNKWGMSSAMVSAMILSDMLSGKENPYAPVFSPSRSIMRPQLAVNALESAFNLLSPSLKRCPHMGCALKWNAHERSWDCPCHGSRFTEEGKLIDNPATGGLKQK